MDLDDEELKATRILNGVEKEDELEEAKKIIDNRFKEIKDIPQELERLQKENKELKENSISKGKIKKFVREGKREAKYLREIDNYQGSKECQNAEANGYLSAIYFMIDEFL